MKTASGLAYKVLTPGSGTVKPTTADLVKAASSAKDRNGKSYALTMPTRPMPVNNIIVPGLQEALQLMTVGQKLRLWLPEKLAFGGIPANPKNPQGPLMVDIVLLDVTPLPVAPADVAAPPADAVKTRSGLASKVIKPGTGTAHPRRGSNVTVHYSGWTTDGKMFDSSVIKGAPASFPLDGVIAGWTEGVQLMVVGETRRFWIPENLAYEGKEGNPKGMLVFDVELIAIDGK